MELKIGGVNGVGTEKERSQRRWNGIIAALTALDREMTGVNGVGTEF